MCAFTRAPAAEKPSIAARNLLPQQAFGDRGPLVAQRLLARRLAGAAVPVAGVGEVALDPVQVRVHPGGLGALVGLDDFVLPQRAFCFVADDLLDLAESAAVGLGLPPDEVGGLQDVAGGDGMPRG